MKFGKKPTWKQVLYSWPSVVVLLLLVVMLAISVVDRYYIKREMALRHQAALKSQLKLEARVSELREQVNYLQGERGIEEEVRRNFDVAKPGEQVVVLTGDIATTSVPEAETEVLRPWWQFWR